MNGLQQANHKNDSDEMLAPYRLTCTWLLYFTLLKLDLLLGRWSQERVHHLYSYGAGSETLENWKSHPLGLAYLDPTPC